jgi:hypothetical protein
MRVYMWKPKRCLLKSKYADACIDMYKCSQGACANEETNCVNSKFKRTWRNKLRKIEIQTKRVCVCMCVCMCVHMDMSNLSRTHGHVQHSHELAKDSGIRSLLPTDMAKETYHHSHKLTKDSVLGLFCLLIWQKRPNTLKRPNKET